MEDQAKRNIQLELAMEVIERGEEVPLKATGLSMGGTIRHGEWIVVQKTDPENISPGDIVIYRYRDTFVAHRVIFKRRDDEGVVFLAKGDAHFELDKPIPAKRIIARIVAVRRKGREMRFDRAAGRITSRILLVYSRLVWGCYRWVRGKKSSEKTDPSRLHRFFERSSRRLVVFTTRLFSWFWHKGTR